MVKIIKIHMVSTYVGMELTLTFKDDIGNIMVIVKEIINVMKVIVVMDVMDVIMYILLVMVINVLFLLLPFFLQVI